MEKIHAEVLHEGTPSEVSDEQDQNEVALQEEFALICRAREGDIVAKTLLLRRHLGFVKQIASQLCLKGVYLHYAYDDLIQDGCLGLFDAMERYQVVNGASFKTFASRRILGAMVDAIRKNSNKSRHLIRKISQAEKVRDDLTQKLLRLPTLAEWRDALPKNLQQEFETLRAEVCFASEIQSALSNEFKEGSFPGEYFLHDGVTPESINISRECSSEAENFKIVLSGVCEKILDERERQILSLRYPDPGVTPMNQIEVGEVIGVSGSRVCQIEKGVLAKLRRHLRAWHTNEVLALLEGMAFSE